MYRMYSPIVYGLDHRDSVLNVGPSLLVNSKSILIITLSIDRFIISAERSVVFEPNDCTETNVGCTSGAHETKASFKSYLPLKETGQ